MKELVRVRVQVDAAEGDSRSRYGSEAIRVEVGTWMAAA